MGFLSALALALVALAGTSSSFAQSPQAGVAPGGRLSVRADSASFLALLRSAQGDESFLGLSFAADEAGAELRAALDLEDREGGGAFLKSGPGRPTGALRLLADPDSYASATALEGPVAIDTSLASGRAVLAAGAGGLAAFGIAEGAGSGLLLGIPERGGIAFEPRAVAVGLCAKGEAWAAAAALALRRGSAGSGGWEPETAPDPAGIVALGSLARELRGESGRASFGLAASWGRLEGPGLAARIEADERLGPLSLRLAAASIGPGFRGLSGRPPDRSLAAAADLRLALRAASNLGISLRLESPAAKPGRGLLFGSSALFRLALPLSRDERLSVLSPRLQIARKPGEGSEVELGIGLCDTGEGWKSSLDLACGVGGERGISGLQVAFASEVEEEGGFGLDAGLSLSALEGGDASAPVMAKPKLCLSIPVEDGAELRLEASGPERGFELAPASAEALPGAFVFSLRYIAPL